MNRSPQSGDVWRYDYLWRWQHEQGETEGRKPRPTAFVAVVPDKAGRTNLFILPITSKPPDTNRLAIEIPQMERRRAGLDDIPLWIMLDEYNHDELDGSYYFNPTGRIGAFGAPYRQKVLAAFVRAARSRLTQRVPRTD